MLFNDTIVLILILMEHAQREGQEGEYANKYLKVLILILMEHAQRAFTNKSEKEMEKSLNPYFNGTCSKRQYDTD